jgi:TPP-dependent pyruvate/acetoin dehydrogenase alpha subunit
MPADRQTASDGYAIKAVAYGMPGVVVDGNDLLAVRRAVLDAVARARRGDGPTLIEARTFRMGGHSTSDDPTRYVPKELIEEWADKDPITRFERYLERRGLWRREVRERANAEIDARIREAVKVAEATPPPGLETIFSDVYRDVPAHLRKQGEDAFDLARRMGDPAAGDGSFPL